MPKRRWEDERKHIRNLAIMIGIVRKITNGMKARNPDGTVNYTRLDLR